MSVVKTLNVHKLSIASCMTDGDGAMHAQMFILLILLSIIRLLLYKVSPSSLCVVTAI